MKKTNFIITIRYEITTFSSAGHFVKEGGGENFGKKLKFYGFLDAIASLDLGYESK